MILDEDIISFSKMIIDNIANAWCSFMTGLQTSSWFLELQKHIVKGLPKESSILAEQHNEGLRDEKPWFWGSSGEEAF